MRPIGTLKIRKHIPKDRRNVASYSEPRPPFDEPLTPGLRKDCNTEAIGFVTHFADSEYEDEWE